MNRKSLIKLLLDVSMTVIYLMLMFSRSVGGFFHETAGIGIGILFALHILLNLSMTKGLFRGVISGKAKPEKVVQLVLDVLLMIFMPVVIVTGILISKELFVINFGLPWEVLFFVHNSLSYVCLAFMGIHILLHLKYLAGIIKKLPTLKFEAVKSAIIRFCAGAAVAVTLYFSVYFALNGNTLFKNESTLLNKNDNTKETQTTEVIPRTSEIVTNPVDESNSSEESIRTTKNNEESFESTEAIDEEESIESNKTVEEETLSLEEFLGNMNCTGCGKHCSLLSPRCGRGNMQVQEAINEYNQIYLLAND